MSNDTLAIKSQVVRKPKLKRTTKRLIFYTSMITFPVFMFCLFYIYVNFAALSMAFKKYELIINEVTGRVTIAETFSFENFRFLFTEAVPSPGFGKALLRNLLIYVMRLFGTSVPVIIFSFYIYKKFMFSEFFRVVLFMPNILSSVVLALLFQYIVNDVYKEVFNAEIGLMETRTPATPKLFTLIFYNLWIGFGSNILLYSSTMSGINDSIVESAQLDGVGVVGEFFYITIPTIFSTVITFTITGLAAIFTDGANLFSFYQFSAPDDLVTIGYYIHVQTLEGDVYESSGMPTGNIPAMNHPQLTALGLCITAVVLPLTNGTKWLLEKYGPNAD